MTAVYQFLGGRYEKTNSWRSRGRSKRRGTGGGPDRTKDKRTRPRRTGAKTTGASRKKDKKVPKNAASKKTKRNTVSKKKLRRERSGSKNQQNKSAKRR